MNEPSSVRSKIAFFEDLANKNVESKAQQKSISKGHDFVGKSETPQVEKEKEIAEPVIKEGNLPTEAPPLKEHTLVKEENLSLPLSIEAQKIQDTPEVEALSKPEVKVVKSDIVKIEEKKVEIEEKVDEPVRKNPHEKLELAVTKFGQLIDDIAKDGSKKLGLDKDGEVTIRERGHFKSRAGGSKDTVEIWTKHIPTQAQQVLATGEPKLMESQAKALTKLKETPWGQAVSKNKPNLAKSLNETIGSLEKRRSLINATKDQIMTKCLQFSDTKLLNIASIGISKDNSKYLAEALGNFSREELVEMKGRFDKATALPHWKEVKDTPPLHEIKIVADELKKATERFSKEDLAHMLMGTDPDKTMGDQAIQMAGWGVPSVAELLEGFNIAIKELGEQKSEGKSIDEPLKKLANTARELLSHRPPIKGLRDDNQTFIKVVISPLTELAEGSAIADVDKELTVAYNEPAKIEKKSTTQKFQQDAVGFKKQMEALAKGKLSEKEKTLLLEGMTADLRAQTSALINNVEVGEFDKQGWAKGNTAETSPNLSQLPVFINDLAYGLTDQVLENCQDPKMAARQLEFLGDLATQLIKDNNLHALMGLSGALSGIALGRLWAEPATVPVSNKFLSAMQEIKTMVSRMKNNAAMRGRVKEAQEKYEKGEIKNPPIPYSGLILTDLTYLDDGVKPTKDGSINGGDINKFHGLLNQFQTQKTQLQKAADDPMRQTGLLDLIGKSSGQNNDERENNGIEKSKQLFP